MTDNLIGYELLRETDGGRIHRFVQVKSDDAEEFEVFVMEVRSYTGATMPPGGTTSPFSEFFSTLEEAESKALALRDQYVSEGWVDVTPKHS